MHEFTDKEIEAVLRELKDACNGIGTGEALPITAALKILQARAESRELEEKRWQDLQGYRDALDFLKGQRDEALARVEELEKECDALNRYGLGQEEERAANERIAALEAELHQAKMLAHEALQDTKETEAMNINLRHRIVELEKEVQLWKASCERNFGLIEPRIPVTKK